MKKICLLFTLLSLSTTLATPYGSCYVANGKAHPMYCSDSSDSGSGTGWVTMYDKNGGSRGSQMVVYVGVAVMGCDEVDTIPVDEDVVGCSFQLGN